MEKFWYDTLASLRTQNETLNSKKMTEVVTLIEQVPEDVKNYILLKLLQQVAKLSWMSFYKNRVAERPDVCDQEEINL